MYNVIMTFIMLVILACWFTFTKFLTRMSLCDTIFTKRRAELNEVLNWSPSKIEECEQMLKEDIVRHHLSNVIPSMAVVFTFPFVWLILPRIESGSTVIMIMAGAIAYIVVRMIGLHSDFKWFFEYEKTLQLAAQQAILIATQNVLVAMASIVTDSPEAVEAMEEAKKALEEKIKEESSSAAPEK